MSKDNQPGFTVGATRGDDLMPKAKERFRLYTSPALQELGLLSKPKPLEKGEKCRCGKDLPWHLFELESPKSAGLFLLPDLGDDATHHCSCGLNWRGEKEDTGFVVRMVQ